MVLLLKEVQSYSFVWCFKDLCMIVKCQLNKGRLFIVTREKCGCERGSGEEILEDWLFLRQISFLERAYEI